MAEKTELDLKQIGDTQAEALCCALRREIITAVSNSGGHLASSLGAVEITVAIHRLFDLSTDRLVFDVGHQCYAHKLLTGRSLDTLRAFGGTAGFPKPCESPCDAFVAGHASNAVSAALGMARARTLTGERYHVLALLGDGALTGGLAYEGLSDAGQSGENLLVVLNDNGMSITRNVGGVAQYLARQRLKPQYIRFRERYRSVLDRSAPGRLLHAFNHRIKQAFKESLLPCSMFEDMGFTYLGPVDGHDVRRLTQILHYAKSLNGPVLLHVRTVKGKGYPPAERNPNLFHGVGPFEIRSGKVRAGKKETFSDVFGQTMCSLAAEDRRVCAVTAAMQTGTGLDAFAKKFPKRFFDVGIAEGHAVTMSAGMAKQGMRPVFAVYSTFLQRAYDMLLHDVAIQKLHVVLAVDRAGLVGDDGETHHGVFDVGYLSTVPGMTILCPSSFRELATMLRRAVEELAGPVAIRYPRGGEGSRYQADSGPAPTVSLREGRDVALVGYGTMVNTLLEAAEELRERGVAAQVIKLNRIAPPDWTMVDCAAERGTPLLVVEETAACGCVGERLAAHLSLCSCAARVTLLNCGDHFVPHGGTEELRAFCALDAASVCKKALEVCGYGG